MPIGMLKTELIVPTLCVGMQPGTLCVPKRTQSVHRGIPTQSVGTISQPTIPRTMKYNNDGPSRHPSPVWKVAVNAP